jgi:hypothetical protein
MTIDGARVAINVEGLPEMPIKGLRISDVIASAKVGMKAFNTEALELHNVQVNADSGPSFLVQDSKELELDGVATHKPLAGTPVVRLDRCPGAILRNSRAFPGTDKFLSVGRRELRSVKLIGDVLDNAKKRTEESPAVEPTREPPTED